MALSLYMIATGVHHARQNAKALRDHDTSALNTLNPLYLAPTLSIANGVANLTHGFGTFWNHACRCMPGSHLDVSAMLTITAFPVVYCIFFVRYHKMAAHYAGNARALHDKAQVLAADCIIGWTLFFIALLSLRVMSFIKSGIEVEICMGVLIFGAYGCFLLNLSRARTRCLCFGCSSIVGGLCSLLQRTS